MTNAQKIRQKFINLMYLVFILFAFIYAPTNTLDSLLYSSRTLKMVNEEALHMNQVLRDSIQYDLQFSQQNPDMVQLVNSLNDTITAIIHRLDSLETSDELQPAEVCVLYSCLIDQTLPCY